MENRCILSKFEVILYKNSSFINSSKYYPSQATNSSYISGHIRILYRKNCLSIEVIHRSTQFSASSYESHGHESLIETGGIRKRLRMENTVDGIGRLN